MTGASSAAQVSVRNNYDEFEFEENFDREELEKAMGEAERRYGAQSKSLVRRTDGRIAGQPAESPFIVRDIEDIVSDQGDDGSLISQRTITPLVYAEHAEQIESGEADDSLAPFFQFRKRGFLNVTDLAAPVWCETQVGRFPLIGHVRECRLRSLPVV